MRRAPCALESKQYGTQTIERIYVLSPRIRTNRGNKNPNRPSSPSERMNHFNRFKWKLTIDQAHPVWNRLIVNAIIFHKLWDKFFYRRAFNAKRYCAPGCCCIPAYFSSFGGVARLQGRSRKVGAVSTLGTAPLNGCEAPIYTTNIRPLGKGSGRFCAARVNSSAARWMRVNVCLDRF